MHKMARYMFKVRSIALKAYLCVKNTEDHNREML